MSYHIALTPYLNNRAYFYHTAPENCEIIKLSPRESVKALIDGNAQAGIVPVAGLEQIGDQFELLGKFGIASEGHVQSVLFSSRIPFKAFTSADTIKLGDESITSVNLLGLLFGYQHGFDNLPRIANAQEEYDGELLIGDSALESMQRKQYLYVMDLSNQWNLYHQLSFVFARWVINKNAPTKFRAELKQWLTTFVENEPELQQITAEREAQRFGMTAGQIMDYLKGIKTWMGEEEQAGQALYLSELQKYQPAFRRSENYPRKQYA